MSRPRPPRLSPVTRSDSQGTVRMIPLGELVKQVESMDRLGTWHLAQALAIAEHIADNPADDEKWRAGLMDRHLKLSGALLGSINSRISTFKFLREVRNGNHGPKDMFDGEGYGG